MSLTSLRRFPFFRLLLAGAIALLWSRSHHATDVLTLFLHRGAAQVFASDRGRAVVLFSNLSLGCERAYTYDYLAAPNAEFDEVRDSLYAGAPAPERLLGVWLAAGPHAGLELLHMPGAKYRMISIPFWQIAILAGLPLLLGLRTFWRRRRWGTAGLCLGCGYDTRFSSDRCPECGHRLPTPRSSLSTSAPA
jgi:hypothetical protein